MSLSYPSSHSANSGSRLLPYLPAFLFLAVSTFQLGYFSEGRMRAFLEDDAYYYLVVAKNIAELGRSEFTPGILTNGYHPLWMIVLVAAGSVLGFTVTMIKLVETLLVFAAMTALIAWFDIRRFTTALLATFALWYVTRSFALNGMETTLLTPLLVIFTALVLRDGSDGARQRPYLLFLTAAAAIGTRLDSAAFVLPMLLIAPTTMAVKLRIVAALAVCGAVYAGINLWLFGAPLPVSGSVKSLGGLQINEPYLSDLVTDLGIRRVVGLLPGSIPYLFAVMALGIAVAGRASGALSPQPLRVAAAATVGMALYGAKLAFASSWQIWPWYNFPTLIFFLIALWGLLRMTARAGAWLRVAEAVPAVLLIAFFVQFNWQQRSAGSADINRAFIEANEALMAGEVVAMGDRAGSFGFDHPGGVYQLEGLVNSRDYLEFLKSGGDLKTKLCQEGISLFADYERPLGQYDSRAIKIFRPMLTSFTGPEITVRSSEELASYENLAVFDNSNGDEGDNRLYLWRLSCPAR